MCLSFQTGFARSFSIFFVTSKYSTVQFLSGNKMLLMWLTYQTYLYNHCLYIFLQQCIGKCFNDWSILAQTHACHTDVSSCNTTCANLVICQIIHILQKQQKKLVRALLSHSRCCWDWRMCHIHNYKDHQHFGRTAIEICVIFIWNTFFLKQWCCQQVERLMRQ